MQSYILVWNEGKDRNSKSRTSLNIDHLRKGLVRRFDWTRTSQVRVYTKSNMSYIGTMESTMDGFQWMIPGNGNSVPRTRRIDIRTGRLED